MKLIKKAGDSTIELLFTHARTPGYDSLLLAVKVIGKAISDERLEKEYTGYLYTTLAMLTGAYISENKVSEGLELATNIDADVYRYLDSEGFEPDEQIKHASSGNIELDDTQSGKG